MEIQKPVIFVKKNLKINNWKINHYTREHRNAAHSIYNLKCSIPKQISIVFHNGSNYDYRFIIKELGE